MKFQNLYKTFLFFVLIILGANANAIGGITSNAQFDPTKEVEDMRVKVLGGYVRITREWVDWRWVWNKRWEPISQNSLQSVKRSNSNYEYTHFEDGKMVFEDRSSNRLLTEPWVLTKAADFTDVIWQDREGSQINYEAWDNSVLPREIKSYQDKNGVKVSFEKNADKKITAIKDHHGNTLVTFEWAVKVHTESGVAYNTYNLKSIADYTGRKVIYNYPNNVENKFESVTDVSGNVWKYTYTDENNKVAPQLEDPEGRAVKYTLPDSIAYASGNTVKKTKEFDEKTRLLHNTESHSSGVVIETWTNSIGETARKTINGELQFTATFLVSGKVNNVDIIMSYYKKHAQKETLGNEKGAEYCELIGGLPRFIWVDTMSIWAGCALSHVDAITYPRTCGNVGCEQENRQLVYMATLQDQSNPIILHPPTAVEPAPYIKTKIVTDARGNKTTYDYDQWRNEIKVTYPDGTSISRTWHKKFAFPLTETNEKGVVTAYEYDAKGNLITLTEAKSTPEQRITRYTYDQFGQLETVITGESTANNTALATTRYEYDDYGNVTKITDPEGKIITFNDYDVLGNARTMKDARANALPTAEQYTLTKTFDTAGNLLTSFDPYGKGTTYTYSKSGDLKTITAANGSTATLTNNASGLPLTITDANNKAARLEYDQANRLTFLTDANGNKAQIAYDDQGRIARTVDGENNATQYTYAQNQLRSIQYPTHKELLEYDNRDRVKQTTQQANSRNYLRKRGYDQNGNLASTTDALENSSAYEYDSLDRIVKITDANSGITQFSYDARDNLVQVKDPEGRLTLYTYNKNNQVLTETKDGDQNTTRKRTYSYDANGNVISSINPEQEKTVYEYDQANRLVKSFVFAQKDQAHPIKVVTYNINEKNQLGGWAQQVSNTLPEGITPTADIIALAETYTYTNLGQLESVTASLGGFTKTYRYSYYPNGLKKNYTNAEGIVYTYYYNKNNQLIAVHIPNNGQITYAEFNWLMPQTLLLPGGQKITYSYTDFLQVKERFLKNSSNQTLAHSLYEYDVESNVKKITANEGDYNFGYDKLYRLKSADYPAANDETFDYDGVGNRTTHTNKIGETTSNETLTYNQKNQLVNTTTNTTITYGANGHTKTQTQNGVTTEYSYNHEERLIAVKRAGVVIAEYTYNPQGQRVMKTVNGNTTWYLYNKNGLAAEYSGTGNLIKEYFFHPQKTWMTDPLFMRTASNEIYYYHNDHLGTPQQLVNSSGAVVWQAKYTAFGKATITTNTIENNLRFPGQYFDSETGLHQNYFRDYDPELGRYLQGDPIGFKGGINFYGYGKGSPLNLVDPLGLCISPFIQNVASNAIGGMVAGWLSGGPWGMAIGGSVGALAGAMGGSPWAGAAAGAIGSGPGGLGVFAVAAVEGYVGNVNICNPNGLNQAGMAGAAGALAAAYASKNIPDPRGSNPLLGIKGKNILKGGAAGFAGGLAQDVVNGFIDDYNESNGCPSSNECKKN